MWAITRALDGSSGGRALVVVVVVDVVGLKRKIQGCFVNKQTHLVT